MNWTIYRLLRRSYAVRLWLSRQLTPTGLGVLSFLLLLGLIGLDIKRSVSYQLFAFLGALLLVALATSRLSCHRVSASRRLPRFGTVGVPLQYRILLRNQGQRKQRGLTLAENFADAFPSFQAFQKVFGKKTPPAVQRQAWLKLLARQRVAIALPMDLPPLATRGETEVIGEIMPLRRGLLPFQTLIVACPDPFGLVNRCQRLLLPQTVLILPKRYEIPQIELPGARRHQAGGLALAAAVGDSEEFRALREYRPGDPLRKIHWKSWAKTGRPIVKESQAEYSVRHALILDTFQANQESEWTSEEAAEVMEEAIAIAASFACAMQTGGQAQESLLDTIFVGLQAHCFTVGRGFGHTENLLTLLAAVQPCRDKSFDSLLPVVQAQMSRLSGCICILLDWDRDRQTLIKQLQAAGIPTLVLIVAAAQGSSNLGLTELPDNSCLTVPESRLHVLQLGDIQKGLWNL